MNADFRLLINVYRLELKKIERAFRQKNQKDSTLVKFWKGLVRDSDGRWLQHYFEGYKYFQYGMQTEPCFTNRSDVSLLKSGIAQSRAFILGLTHNKFEKYQVWLMSLHSSQVYNNYQSQVACRKRFALIIHSKIVVQEILPLVKRYGDPYKNKGTQTLRLPMIAPSGLPKDIWHNKHEVSHYYPNPKYLKQYLAVMENLLCRIVEHPGRSHNEILSDIAQYYQYGINTHMFENVNQSLFANQVNTLLCIFGYTQINHGILDFAAMRLQPKNFEQYFIGEVKRASLTIKKKVRSKRMEWYLRLAQKK